jgi:pimeloyl-ACP methyl ester carboxylesterase
MKRLAMLVAGLLLAGILYEQIGEHRDRNRYPQVGHSVDIGGRTLNLYCSGQGSPSVIFEGAGHTAGYAWADMQRKVAGFTRACWYDRAGYGWSDPGPSPRTFKAIANDLHTLLNNAGVSPPYVLIGAMAGAFHVRLYNALYPRDVAGAVLIHADDADVFAHEPEYMKGALANLPPFVQRLGCKILRPMALRIGLLRLMGNPGAGRPFGLANLTPAKQEEAMFLSNNPGTAETEGEGCFLDEDMAEVRGAGNFGNRPLFVLASAQRFRAPSPQYAKSTEALNDYWFNQLQPRLAALSSRGHLIVADNAESPESIIQATHDVVAEIRESHIENRP